MSDKNTAPSQKEIDTTLMTWKIVAERVGWTTARVGVHLHEENERLRKQIADSATNKTIEIPTPTEEEWWNMVLKREGMPENDALFTAHHHGMCDTLEFLRERMGAKR